jgi:hypothetical protein
VKTTLPTDSAKRKRFPLRKGCFNYFPAILAGVAEVSIDGNDKHNPGQPLHHARGKSGDHADCVDRHLTDVEDILARIKRDGGTPDAGLVKALLLEANQLAWRALALGQELHEQYGGAPLAPAAVVPAEVPFIPSIVAKPEVLDALRKQYEKLGAVVTGESLDMQPIYGPAGADWREGKVPL